MSEDVVAVWLIFGLMPIVGLIAMFVRRMRREDMDRFASRLRGGVQVPGGEPLPDGKTMIELEKLRLADRDKARQLFERLTMEKLDVVKTSIQSGYKEEELTRLDERLERIIGSERLQRLLDESTTPAQPGPAPQSRVPGPASAELSSADLGSSSGEAAAARQSTSG
ncbi:hypothetical protein IT575_14275 [bacterium]|nr:hypothetical protein [bacterium]